MNLIQFITTRRFVKHFGISILITLVLSWAILSTLKHYTKHGKTIEVPSFVGMSLPDLDQLEQTDNFDIMVVDSVFDYTKKGGIIVSQDPQPKSKVKPGRTIYLSITSFLPEQIKMPALVDLSLRQAKALLQTYGLQLGSIRVIPDPAKNAIIQVISKGRNIPVGTLITKGSVIDLYVGSGTGSNEVRIPFLIGKTRTQAISEIVKLGLELGEENYSDDADSLNSRVYLQDPMYIYGKIISAGSVINLDYRSGVSFDFDEYIMNLEIDTVKSDSIQN
jgi:eukaryotic-like serine/threonine-protein kinase